jgi:hypothetical protein
MDTPSLDTLLRVAAFERVRGLNEIHDHLTAAEFKARISLSRRAHPAGQSPAWDFQAATDAVSAVD